MGLRQWGRTEPWKVEDFNKALQQIDEEMGQRGINPLWFGCKGNGIQDDTQGLQDAADYAISKGLDLILPSGYVFQFSELRITKPNFSLRGYGALLNGTIVMGDPVLKQEMFFSISQYTHKFTSIASGNNAIEIQNSRRGEIRGVKFINCDKSISVPTLPNAEFHSNAQVVIDGNTFMEVNYALYIDRDEATTTWMVSSDFHFTNNIVNTARYQHIYCKSIDGIVINNNTFFFPSSTAPDELRSVKKQNIYIGQSDWVIITNNNLFEAGEESIWLDTPSHVIISTNNIAWPGQKNPYDAIKLTGNSMVHAIIKTNNMARFSKHAIAVHVINGAVFVEGNIFEYDPNQAANYNHYFGSVSLTSFEHYGVFQDPLSNARVTPMTNDQLIYNNIKGMNASVLPLSKRSSLGNFGPQVQVLSANTPIATFTDSSGSNMTFDGIIHLTVKNTDHSNSNSASYLLHVGKHFRNSSCFLISENGMNNGEALNHPSFTFTLDESKSQLLASPIGQTQGVFYFFITTVGNIKVVR